MTVHNRDRVQLGWTFKVSAVACDAVWRCQKCKPGLTYERISYVRSCHMLLFKLGYSDIVPTTFYTGHVSNLRLKWCRIISKSTQASTSLVGYYSFMPAPWYLTQSHYPDTEPTSAFSILVMPSAFLGSDKYKWLSHWLDLTRCQNIRSLARS